MTSTGEIVVVDDASTDGTGEWLDDLAERNPMVTVLRNERNAGFLESCNRAADVATGEFLLFLNNDTILLPGWLPPLLRVFAERDDAGAAGGRLLYPDGRLQEAGGLVFRDGSAWKFGYGDPDPEAPVFSYLREVDYCSGCLLATPRSRLRRAGRLRPPVRARASTRTPTTASRCASAGCASTTSPSPRSCTSRAERPEPTSSKGPSGTRR